MKREPGISRGKPPFHRGAGCVSRLLPRFYFWAHALAIRQPLVQTPAGQLGAFALRHIQPTAVLRRGMKRQRPRQPSGLLRREGLLQRSRRMGVPVVQHDPAALGCGERRVHQPLHLPGNVVVRPPLRRVDGPPAAPGLEKQEQVARAVALVCIIHPLGLTWFHRQGLPTIRQQLRRSFVHADNRALGIGGFGGAVAPIVHPPENLSRARSEAPLPLLPGLAFVWFTTRRTGSSEMDSATSSSTSRSARRCIVQCSRPSGGALQAGAIRNASCLPSRFGWAPGRGRSCTAASRPSAAHRFRLFRTGCGLTVRPSALDGSVAPAAERSRSRVRGTIRAFTSSCFRRSSRDKRSVSVSVTTDAAGLGMAPSLHERSVEERIPYETSVVKY
jgi:hypothetical protein